MSWAAAAQAEILTELARRRPPGRHDRSRAATGGTGTVEGAPTAGGATRGPLRYSTFTADEVAAALGWSPHAADRRLQTAIDLHTRLPQVADALHEGRIDLAKARVISEATRGLGDEAALRVAVQALRTARNRPLTPFKADVTRAACAADPTLAARRHTAARSERRIVQSAESDGMCLYGAVLPAGQAALISSAVTSVARASLAPDDDRTLEQARVDSFTDLLLGGAVTPSTTPHTDTPHTDTPHTDAPHTDAPHTDAPHTGSPHPENPGCDDAPGAPRPGRGRGRVNALVNITVPATTLRGSQAFSLPGTTMPGMTAEAPDPSASASLGWLPFLGTDLSRLPGDTDRSGPLDADQAITTALTALSGGAPIRWVVTDPHGRAIAASVPGHRRPLWLEQLVKTFDRTCRAPGCRAPAEQCDTDHVIPYPRGSTAPGNLANLCRRHHRMKTHTRWGTRLLNGGVIEWTSPTGHVYTTHPGQWLPPLEPPPWLDTDHAHTISDGPTDPDDGAPPDPGDPSDDPSWWATVTVAEPPQLEAAGPDTHPVLGDPLPDNPLPDDLLPDDPWAPADPDAEDPLAQDPTDARLYQPMRT
jgi:hypothetical protein